MSNSVESSKRFCNGNNNGGVGSGQSSSNAIIDPSNIPGTSRDYSYSIPDNKNRNDHNNNTTNDDDDFLEQKRKTSSSSSSSNKDPNCSTTNNNNKQANRYKRSSNRFLNSRIAHGKCLYYPGAYSSHGQFSQMQRRQCSQIYCCRCQHQMNPPTTATNELKQHQTPSSQAAKTTNNKLYSMDPINHKRSSSLNKSPESLLEIMARYVAQYFPYEYIEQQYSCIPEPVQRRIIFWSFPRDERYIRLYSSISSIFTPDSVKSNNSSYCQLAINSAAGASSSSSSSNNYNISSAQMSSMMKINMDYETESRSTFYTGLYLLCSGTVRQVMQIGFTLTGIVIDPTLSKSSNVISPPPPQPSNYGNFGLISPSSSNSPSSSSTIDHDIITRIHQDLPLSSGESYSSHLLKPQQEHNNRKNNLIGCSVSITFDRCKITAATCTCTPKVVHLFWCEHVVALALYRIHRPYEIDLRIPISETLFDLDRQQLQKLVQYLIAEHHVQILPTVQRLTDELSQKNNPINLMSGAPDPTAGACVYGAHDWYLNEEKTAMQIRDLIKYISISESNKLILLFYKVIEMLKIKDSNGSRFLRIITEQFLSSYSHYLKADDAFEQIHFDPFIFLWDHLTNLWIFIVADPNMSPMKRMEWREMFRHWSQTANCPREDSYFRLCTENMNDTRFSSEMEQFPDIRENPRILWTRHNNFTFQFYLKRSILGRAIDATHLTWDDDHLQMILRQEGPVSKESRIYYSEYFDRDGFPIWSEHLPTACVRVASLRVNGRTQEALRLSMAIIRYFRHRQRLQEQNETFEIDIAPASESWIGNPLDPIGILFDTLAEASLTCDSKSFDGCYALVGYNKKIDMGIFSRNVLVDVFDSYNEMNCLTKDSRLPLIPAELARPEPNEKPKYRHIRVPGSKHHWDTYLNAALYAALVGLSQHRRSTELESQRDRFYRQEERLIRKLLDIKLDSILVATLQKHARFLIQYGLLSDMVTGENRQKNIPVDIVQIPGLVRYMFGALLQHDPNLSYNIGLRSLRFFAFKDDQRPFEMFGQIQIKSNFGLNLDVQSLLARTMLFAARNDYPRLQLIFETIKTYVIDPHYLHKLTQDIFNFNSNGPRQENLILIAYQFGLHLTKMTLNDDNTNDNCRKNTISWLMTCSTVIGGEKILYLMKHWEEYFTPSEAVRHVASAVLAQNFNSRCNHNEIASAKKLAVECAMRDPSSCALHALSLCEKDPLAFDTISKVVEKAAQMNEINSHKLFTIARYMEHHGASERACKIALLAANQVIIPLTADSHSSINDLQWACGLAQNLGITELKNLVNILIKNVRCAPVLADMIRRCTLPQQIVPKHMFNVHNHMRPLIQDSSNHLLMEHLSLEEKLRRRHMKTYPLDCPPLSNLLEAAVKAYIEAVMRRLEHISPRHYSDFIDFLTRAHETILLAPDGKEKFIALMDTIKTTYKGKKKLMCLVKERFDCYLNYCPIFPGQPNISKPKLG